MIRTTVWVDTVTCYEFGQSMALAPEGRVKVTDHFIPTEQDHHTILQNMCKVILCESIDCELQKNSQFAIIRFS